MPEEKKRASKVEGSSFDPSKLSKEQQEAIVEVNHALFAIRNALLTAHGKKEIIDWKQTNRFSEEDYLSELLKDIRKLNRAKTSILKD